MNMPSEDDDDVVEINVVPLLDLAWNLLVVFMIVVTASVQGISVNLPKASGQQDQTKYKSDYGDFRRYNLSR
jgi:biopolymer transport protein ExbD